jgi:hypothetical protein
MHDYNKKWQPGACSLLAQGPEKGPTTLGLMYAVFPYISA